MIDSLINDETIKGWIFDLDGVITDTAVYHYQAWKKLADEESLIFNETINENLRGISRRASLEIILAGKILPDSVMEEMMERKNSYYCELLKNLTSHSVLPGILPLLEKLHLKGRYSAIASASRNTDFIIDHLQIRPYFNGVASGYSVKRPKPAPDIFVHAAGQLKLPVKNCIVIEDAEAGVSGAIEAGFRTIGIGPEERVGHSNYRFSSTNELGLSK